MISKKIHYSEVINFYDKELTIHSVIEKFREIGIRKLISKTKGLDDFDNYIISYFYDGIKINKES